MSDLPLTKRLHISGLTPSITPADLERRLSVFGKVKTMDGFGARDGLGDPRKFGFVTMEIATKELTKCLNVLSGSTWKGAKLRIGEAKPDFRERIAQMNAQPLKSKSVRPKRMPRNHGRPSSTLPLTPLSATTAAITPGWTVTPSGRVVRPMRMRPDHPLDPTRTEPAASKGKTGKAKKRVKPPPIRARRKLIDPTKWDSVYLKGVYLDSVEVPMPKTKAVLKALSDLREEEGMESESESEEEDKAGETDDDEPSHPPPEHAQSRPTVTSVQQVQTAASVPTSARTPEPTGSIDIREEANAALAMLGNMFGDQGDWGGSESVDELEGLDGVVERNGDAIQVNGEDDIEIVPRNHVEGKATKTKKEKKKGKGEEKAMEDPLPSESDRPRDTDVEMQGIAPSVGDHASSSQAAQPAPQTSLRTLFAPREEVLFSLVDHLDLDLELEDDILGLNVPPGPSQVDEHAPKSSMPIPQVAYLTTTTSRSKASDQGTLDPSYPLLFPLPESLPYPYTSSSSSPSSKPSHSQSTPNCMLFPPRTTPPRNLTHLNFLPPAHTFSRSLDETSETIRARWEREKVALTREWKKASRDARGSRRARADRALPDVV